jgi:lipoic acid synthetase
MPSQHYTETLDRLRSNHLTTVCREAKCPNITQCWSRGTATMMLLGERCTRHCSFCSVTHERLDGSVDADEPRRVAEAVRSLGLKYVVLTMVARDDLPDQGAGIVAGTVKAIREACPGTKVEALTSDLGGSVAALRTVLDSRPDVFGHNVETVRRLTPEVRDPQASYDGSLGVLRKAKETDPPTDLTKSSIMLGLGETREELIRTLRDLRGVGVDIVTMGQYLRPGGEGFHQVVRYATPEEFSGLGALARSMGFKGVASGPMVRSSYMAEELCRSSHGKEW